MNYFQKAVVKDENQCRAECAYRAQEAVDPCHFAVYNAPDCYLGGFQQFGQGLVSCNQLNANLILGKCM